MKLHRKLANFLQKKEDRRQKGDIVRVIYDRDNMLPYMTRYYLFNTRFFEENAFIKKYFPWMKIFSWNLVMHNVHKSDEDGLHDHPWPWATFILEGGYLEREPYNPKHPSNSKSVVFKRTAGNFRVRSSSSFHRLELSESEFGQETWTLFLMGPRIHTWGFLNENNNLIPHTTYLKNRNKKEYT